MSSLDRWFVQNFHGQEALGLYALGAKFSMLIALAVEIFRKAWWPIAMDAMHGDDAWSFRMISRLYLSLGIIVVILITSISPWLVGLLALMHTMQPGQLLVFSDGNLCFTDIFLLVLLALQK